MTPNQLRLLDAIERFPNSSATKLSLELGLGQGYLERELSYLVRVGKAVRHENLYRVAGAELPQDELATTLTEPPEPRSAPIVFYTTPTFPALIQPVTQEIPPVSKTNECRRCHESKHVVEFGDDSRTPDGKARLCKGCRVVGGKARAKQSDKPKPAKAAKPARVKTLRQVVANHTARQPPQFDARAVLLAELRERRAAIDVAIAAIERIAA